MMVTPDIRKHCFEPFSWLAADAQTDESHFVEITHDVMRGISMALDLIHTSDLEDEARTGGSDCVPILASQDREYMLLFVKASAKLLHQYAEERIEVLNSAARHKEAKEKGSAK